MAVGGRNNYALNSQALIDEITSLKGHLSNLINKIKLIEFVLDGQDFSSYEYVKQINTITELKKEKKLTEKNLKLLQIEKIEGNLVLDKNDLSEVKEKYNFNTMYKNLFESAF